MDRRIRKRIYSFLLSLVMFLTAFASGGAVSFAQETEADTYTITITETQHGTLSVKDHLTAAAAGSVIYLIAVPQEGYQLKELHINEGAVTAEAVPDTTNEYRFTMPEAEVRIQAVFEMSADTSQPVQTENQETQTEHTETFENDANESDETHVPATQDASGTVLDTEIPEESNTNSGNTTDSGTSETVSGNDAAASGTSDTGAATKEPAETTEESPEDASEEGVPESAESQKETLEGIYLEFQTMTEILALAEQGLDLEEFFRYTIWGFLTVEDLQLLIKYDMDLEELYDVIMAGGEGAPEEIQGIVERYYERFSPRLRRTTYALGNTAAATATADIQEYVSDSALGTISAFGGGSHGPMLRITLDGMSAFCAQYGAACSSGMTYTKVTGDELGIDRGQQYLIYRIIGWYYEAQAINDNTGNYAIAQAAIWLVRNGQWSDAQTMTQAILPVINKVAVLDDDTSYRLFEGMANWVNNEDNQPQVGVDFWSNGPNQYLVTVGGETTIESPDPEYSAYVKIYKTDAVTGSGLNGTAQFKIYTEDGTDTGATFSKSVSTYTSSSIIKDADHATFYVQEVGSPTGYLPDGGKYYFTIEDGDINAEKVITNNGSSFANNPYWVLLTIPKTDAETGKMIANNAQFSVSAASGSVSQAVTFSKQADGSYLSSKVYYNESNTGRFYLQETKAPANYYGDWEDEAAAKTPGSNTNKVKYSFTVDGNTHGQTLSITNSGDTFSNERTKGTIHVYKIDTEAEKYVTDDVAHGDAVLDGAVYGLYAREDILYPDGVSGIKYEKDTLITEGTIVNGTLTWEDLYLGAYYVKEITPGVGYLLDPTEYEVVLSYENEAVEIVVEETTVEEQVKKQAFQLRKLEGEALEEQYELSGAGFEVYLLSDLGIAAADKTDKELIAAVEEKYPDYEQGLGEAFLAKLYENDPGQIDAYNATQHPLGSEGLTEIGENYYQLNEIFTDAAGHLTSPELPYGTYVVIETTVPKNTLIDIKPFIVRITEDSREVQYQRYFLDKDFTAKIKVVKKDADTGEAVLKAGTSFKIYDLDNQKYVKIPIVVDNKEEIREVFTSDVEGYILTDAALPCGRYRIEEVQGPEGFYNEAVGTNSTLGTVEFEINTDQVYHMSEVSGDAIIELTYSNRETRGELTIEKIGEQLTGAENVPEKNETGNEAGNPEAGNPEAPGQDVAFVYEKLPLAGAEYTIEAAEDIYTQDNQLDETGDRTLWFAKGETVAVVVTGENGQMDSVKYPTGGFAEHPIVEVLHKGETGKVTLRLPLGSYHIYESAVPYGFLLSDEVKTVTFTWENQSEEIVFDSTTATDENGVAVFENERVKPIPEEEFTEIGVGIYKHDTETKEPVADTVFGLYTRDDIFNLHGELLVPAGTLLSEVTTDETGFTVFPVDIPYMSEGYTQGSTGKNSGDYYIKEHGVSPSYFLDQTPLDVHFAYVDEHTPYIVVQAKQENIPTSVDLLKTDLKQMPLPGAVLQVIEQATGEVVHEFTSAEEAYTLKRLKLSTEETEHIYLLREKTPAPGYVTAEDIAFKLVQAADEEGTLLMEADVYVWQVQETEQPATKQAGLIKSDLEGQEAAVIYVRWELENERLTLYVNEEIEAEILSQVVRESDFAHLTFTEVYFAEGSLENFYEDLVVKDTLLDKLVDFFTPGTEETDQTYSWVKVPDATVTMEDDVTKVLINKYDITEGTPVIGAEMEITDAEGNVIEKWTTTEEDYYIEMLPVGEYILKETLPPVDGYYVKAEDIPFTVEDDGSIQKVKMADDYTRVEILKVDASTKAPLKGATLAIEDASGKELYSWVTDGTAYRMEKLPQGTYTLVEKAVPAGYQKAADIRFTVTDEAKTHVITMEDKPITPQPEHHDSPDTPDTPAPIIPKLGFEDSTLGIAIAVMVVLATGLGGTFIYRRRKNNSKS